MYYTTYMNKYSMHTLDSFLWFFASRFVYMHQRRCNAAVILASRTRDF